MCIIIIIIINATDNIFTMIPFTTAPATLPPLYVFACCPFVLRKDDDEREGEEYRIHRPLMYTLTPLALTYSETDAREFRRAKSAHRETQSEAQRKRERERESDEKKTYG